MNKKFILTLWLILSALNLSAQTLNYTAEEQKVWEKHQAAMAEPVDYLAADALSAIQADYHVNPPDVKALRKLCKRMETHKYLHNYILESARGRLSIKRQIEANYWDSIADILIPNNPSMAGTYTGYAVLMSKELGLSEDIMNYLKNNAFANVRRMRKNPRDLFFKEEMDSLKTVLDRQQIEKIVYSVHAAEADARSQAVWSALEVAGLTQELEKPINLSMATHFYQKELFIRDYYMSDERLMEANLEDLYRHIPRIVKMYEGLHQKEMIQKRHEEKVGTEYSW